MKINSNILKLNTFSYKKNGYQHSTNPIEIQKYDEFSFQGKKREEKTSPLHGIVINRHQLSALQTGVLNKILSDEKFYNHSGIKKNIRHVLNATATPEAHNGKIAFLDGYLANEKLQKDKKFNEKITHIIGKITSIEHAQNIIKSYNLFQNCPLKKKRDFLEEHNINLENINKNLNEKIQKDINFINTVEKYIYKASTNEQLAIINNILEKKLYKDDYIKENFINWLYDQESYFSIKDSRIINKVFSNEKLYKNKNILKNFTRYTNKQYNFSEIPKISIDARIELLNEYCDNKKLHNNKYISEKFGEILVYIKDKKTQIIASKILSNEKLVNHSTKEKTIDFICDIITKIENEEDFDKAIYLLDNYEELDIPPKTIATLLRTEKDLTIKDIRKLCKTIGSQNVNKLESKEIALAFKMLNTYNKNYINEIALSDKRDFLRNLVASNKGLFFIGEEMENMFPLLPTSQEKYCKLLPALVNSIGIETQELNKKEIEEFNQSLFCLSQKLSDISDKDFNNLSITQEYPKDIFINNTLKIVKSLSKQERQKVYDYFGFELHHNKENQNGFTITGYPTNLNNGKKLSEIKNQNTREIIEKLRPEVIRFSKNNKILCNNKEIEKYLNEITKGLYELHPQIEKKQHLTHNFDILKHSLKVMQKITQNPKFEELNDSDKKIMLLASLLHDITKKEGEIDKSHPTESAFDGFFISKKFNLNKEEEIKLYTLMKNHDWLEKANTIRDERNLQNISYDFRNDNLFEMAKIFTIADLKAVKKDDEFFDRYSNDLDKISREIEKNILELQKSQPLLPVTKFPKASKINKALDEIFEDGSTNIKGVYKNKDGLIILKFNEIEDWEKIGFEKGAKSKGIIIEDKNEKINTGNIKFFAHGLDWENQLIKFDAFSLINSDALLSISYSERPESKYRFFRPQGVILDFNTENIHGGGESDSGSGTAKTITTFKNNYIFGGKREKDRLFVSNLIKKTLELDDNEYIEFVKANKNKSFCEIEPIETREKLIKAFALISSKIRGYNREYNEMYGSNPNEIMAVYAYSINYNDKIENPVEFLERDFKIQHENKTTNGRTAFLQKYALEHDIPFVIFGD